MSKQATFHIPTKGISRDVIDADIRGYLGRNARVVSTVHFDVSFLELLVNVADDF